MPVDQSVASYRMRLIAMIQAAPSIRQGCAAAGIHHSTYYDWMRRVDADGPDGLGLRRRSGRARSYERGRLESRVVAAALAYPAKGPRALRDVLLDAGVEVGSESQVWRILRTHELNTRRLRFRLMAVARGGVAADAHVESVRAARSRPRIGHLDAEVPGDLVQMDCFQIGPLKEARLGTAKKQGMVWQYTAIDVASSFVWAELHTTVRNPSAVHTTALAMRVAQDLAAWEWTWQQVSTDRGNEFVDHRFRDTIDTLGVTHRFIAPGRPQSNGKVEQVHDTILQECWKPTLVTYTEPSITGLRHDLIDYLDDYNHHRRHYGRWNQGATPASIIIPNTGNTP